MTETLEKAEALDVAREDARRRVYTAFMRHGTRNHTTTADRMAAATEAVELIEPYIRARISAETHSARNYAEAIARRSNGYAVELANLKAEREALLKQLDTLRSQRDAAWSNEDKALDKVDALLQRVAVLSRPWWLRWLG